MFKYIIRRLILAFVTLIAISMLIFWLLRVLPGDPANMLAGEVATQSEIEAIRARYNLDKPIPVQYFYYVRDILHGDLGNSLKNSEPVADQIAARFPATLQLAVISIILAAGIGIPLGVLAAIKHYTWIDSLISVTTLFGVASPVYATGLLLMLVFAVQLHWLPAAGRGDSWHSAILPSITLASFSIALIARMTRASVLEVMSEDYVRTARAKGQTERRIITKHILRNALIPVVTVVGLQFGSLLGGAILTETIFAWPGLGQILVSSMYARDYPMIQSLVLLFAAMFILVNIIVDILYIFIDPRIRYD